jgi:transcriptional regulator GlxA family with amidase domain
MNTQQPDRSLPEIARFRRIGFLVYPDCEILDVCGPFEAFYFAHLALGLFGRTKEPSYQSLVLATAPGPVRTMSGLEIVATHRCSEIVDGLDTLVVVGGTGCDVASKDPALVEWVRSIAPKTRRVASVCSGAFILAAAGLLHHRRVTTHWMYSDLLAKTYPTIEVDANLIFVRDGNIYTSGGITTGIDLALALVEEDLGSEIMLGVARTLIVFPKRPGGQSQFRAHTSPCEKPIRPNVSELQGWMLAHPDADLSVQALADRMAMSLRSFSRLFLSETGLTPAEYAERARADAARCKLEQTLVSVETIAEECGFGNAERMRRTFQRLYHTSPADYRARFRSTQIV